MGNVRYEELYNLMEDNKFYTAKELGVAAATLTAMYNRGMVERTETSPRKYRKIVSAFTQVCEILKQHLQGEYFVLFTSDRELGMMCSLDVKNEKILDCYGKTFPLDKVVSVLIGQNLFPL